MEVAAKRAMMHASPTALAGIADPAVAERLLREMDQFSRFRPVTVASSFAQLREAAGRAMPAAILVDDELLRGLPLAELLRQLTAFAPVILLAPAERLAEAARHVAAGEIEFVARAGDFIPLAAALIERRLRWLEISDSLLTMPPCELPADLSSIFRHEINNPLTGILGNAELLLSHRERLTAADTQRLQTVVELAVRLRETIRRLSNAWEAQSHSLKSA